jgi:membrane protein implicated in regulation of membrane protease activity
MPDWVIWALVAAALVAGELFTPGVFFLGLLAIGAVLAMIAAVVGASAALQLGVFILASIGTVALLRPLARRHIEMPRAIRTGTAALVGARATVIERVDADGGRVKIGGEIWSARTYMDDQVIEPGTRCEVVKIEGATALVME